MNRCAQRLVIGLFAALAAAVAIAPPAAGADERVTAGKHIGQASLWAGFNDQRPAERASDAAP